MKNRLTFWLLATLFLANVSLADAQQTGKIPLIGFLDNSTASGITVLLEAFRQELRELGYIEGQNISTEYRYAEGKVDWVPQLVAELVRLKSCADWDSSSRYLLLSPMKQSFTPTHKNGFFRSRYSLKV